MKTGQIVFVKAYCGWADRLRTLNQALIYCQIYKASICIDWEDDIWGMPFSELFDLVKIPVVSKKEVLEKIRNGATMNKNWTYAMLRDRLTEQHKKIVASIDYSAPFMNSVDSTKFIDSQPQEDILITNSKGFAITNMALLCSIFKIKKEVVEVIAPYLKVFETPKVVVHLRGTDRMNNDFLKYASSEFEKLTQEEKKNTLVITDSPLLMKMWIEKYPMCRPFRKNTAVSRLPNTTKGSHIYTIYELRQFGLTKKQINIETLIDFFAIVFAHKTIGMKESFYYETAMPMKEFKFWNLFSTYTGTLPTYPCASRPSDAFPHPQGVPAQVQAHEAVPQECPAP